jgi:5-methylcytosine-specific restriction protein A
MPSVKDFRNELMLMMREAQRAGNESIDVEAGELHRRVGAYPGRDHRMPICCGVMREQLAVDYGDVVTNEPPKGQGAKLRIRYRLPRIEAA